MVEAEVASFSPAIGDALTGLANRRGFEMPGERPAKAACRLGLPPSVVCAELDNVSRSTTPTATSAAMSP